MWLSLIIKRKYEGVYCQRQDNDKADKLGYLRYNTLTRSNISLFQGAPNYPPEAKRSSLKKKKKIKTLKIEGLREKVTREES